MGAETQKESSRDKAVKRVGTTVCGKWRIEKLIGFGGMAAVYAAKHESGHFDALKIMHAELCREDEIVERFLREGEIARKIDHPGVVRISSAVETEQGEPVLVMELLRGRTLSSLWRKHDKKLPLDASLRIASQILDALTAFHAKGIVHRDLKPANIFITKKGEVKVLDLGVAQHREVGREMTRAGLAMGTPSFMAPEQALGKSEEVDHRADIYAVGATLYTLISGKKLHRGKTAQESQIMAATQPAPSIARVAPELGVAAVALVDKALQWDPRNRFQSARAMHKEVKRLLNPATAVPSEKPHNTDIEELAIELDLDDGSRASSPDIVSGLGARDSGSLSTESVSVGSTGASVEAGDTTESDMAFELAVEVERGSHFAVRPAPVGLRSSSEVSLNKKVAAGGQAQPVRRVPTGGQVPARRRAPTGARPGLPATIEEVPLPAEHPLTPMLITLDRLLRTSRQYGPSHPETQARLEPVFEATAAALERMPDGIHLRILPFCLMLHQDTAWEPKPPGDLVPYTLSVAGLREVHITEGVEDAELRELLGAMMIDANSNPSDIATALWEAPFQHIQCRIEEDLGAEQAESLEGYFAEAAELERELESQLSAVQKMALTMQRGDVMEAAAMAAMRDASESTAAMLRLDNVSHKRLSLATNLSAAELRSRHDRLLIDAFEDAAHRRDLDALVTAVGVYARRLVRLGRDEELYETHRALVTHLKKGGGSSRLTPAFVTATLFPGDVLQHVVRTATGWSDLLSDEQRERALAGFALITQSMNTQGLPTFLSLADSVGAGPLLEHIVKFVVRVSEGEEEIVLRQIEALNPVTAQSVLTELIKSGGDRVKKKMRPLLKSKNSALRCEAIALIAPSHIALTQELMKLFLSDNLSVRTAALETFVRHKVRSAGPRLVSIVEDETFVERTADEQERILNALWALNPARSEKLLSELVSKHGLMTNDVLDQTRMLAARMLADRGDTQRALEALQVAEARRPWNSAELRTLAAASVKTLLKRVRPTTPPPNTDDDGGAQT